MKKISLLISFLLVGILASFKATAFESFLVNQIRVEGLRRVSEGAVLNELPFKVGHTITETQTSEAIRLLFRTGYFKDVTLARSGNTLIIQVIERTSISKLSICGIKDKDKILKVLREAGVAEGRFYDPALVAAGQKALEKHYFSKGKYGVRIEHSVTEESPSLMQVKFDIYEGDIARIKQIRIVGNTVFTEKELMKDFHSAKTNWLSWFTHDNQYAKEKLNADLETLRSYYLDRGYLFVQVDSAQVSLTPDKKDIYITIRITEGEKYYFGNIGLAGEFPVSEACLRPLLAPLCPGQPFSRKALMDVKQSLEDRLGCEGYSIAEVAPNHQINEKEKIVDITFQVKPGKRVYVRRIEITGNATTQDEVLRRELPQMEATWVSTGLIKEGKEQLLRKGFAKEIEIETTAVPGSPDQMDVIYDVEEARMGQINLGAGYSGTEKLMFNFSVSQENFLGTGKMVDFAFDKSRSVSSYALGYQDPYFTIDGIGLGASAYYNKAHLSKTTNISDYIADTLGGETRLIFPMSKYDAFYVSVGYDRTQLRLPSISAIELRNFVNKYGTKFTEAILGAGWRHDSLNQRIFPTRGLSQNLGVHWVVPGANQQYYRTSYDIKWFYPVSENERWVVNLNSTLAFADGYGKTRSLPFYRNYFAGGSKFVRGFEENSLGPKDSLGRAFGGNALVAASASLIFPNPIKPDAKSIRTALFLDAGQVYDTRDRVKIINGVTLNHKSNCLRYSAGISLAWHSPFGAPIHFSLAKPLNFKPGDERRTFNFLMGTQF